MLLSVTSNAEQQLVYYEYIFPAVLADAVAVLGIIVQFVVGIRSNRVILKSIWETKMIESRIKFYRPFGILIHQIIIFFKCYEDFDFCADKYNDVEYQKQLGELKIIYLKICEWYEKNFLNIYPENKNLDEKISKVYDHMSSILHISIESPKSWNVLKEYKRNDIEELINSIINEISVLSYK